jgi:membrane-bound hydrogenase subunit mbhJ
MLPRLARTYEQVPEPKALVAVGTCAASMAPFIGSDMIEGPVDGIIPVDAYVVGCPPRPEAILRGIVTAVRRKFL